MLSHAPSYARDPVPAVDSISLGVPPSTAAARLARRLGTETRDRILAKARNAKRPDHATLEANYAGLVGDNVEPVEVVIDDAQTAEGLPEIQISDERAELMQQFIRMDSNGDA